jgi:anti-sigma-K factor RskA
MSENDQTRWSEEIPAYVLGALEPEQAAALERHLEGCERCRAEVRWLMPAVESLPESVQRLEPPPQLRERLMAEVREDAQRSGADAPDRGEGRGLLERIGLGSLGWRPAAAIGAVALVLFAVVGYEIGNNGSGGGGATSTVISGHAPGITAKMVREGEGGTLSLANVQPLPDGRVLEAWVQRNGEVEPVPALFVPNREGRAKTTIANMNGVDTVMVTSEPSGGSKAPTSTPIVTMPIPQ